MIQMSVKLSCNKKVIQSIKTHISVINILVQTLKIPFVKLAI